MVDRASLNLYVRLAASASLATGLLHAGMHFERAAPGPLAGGLLTFVSFVATVAGLWALSRFNVKRAALWTALVLLGVVPLVAVGLQWRDLLAGGFYAGLLWTLGVAGLATVGTAGYALSVREA